MVEHHFGFDKKFKYQKFNQKISISKEIKTKDYFDLKKFNHKGDDFNIFRNWNFYESIPINKKVFSAIISVDNLCTLSYVAKFFHHRLCTVWPKSIVNVQGYKLLPKHEIDQRRLITRSLGTKSFTWQG